MSCNTCTNSTNIGNSGGNCCNQKAMDVVTPLEEIRNGDQNFCFTEITDEICENLSNDEGIHPSATNSNSDCEDLSSLNDLATGSLNNLLIPLNMCDVDAFKCWLKSLISWNWNMYKAIICAICGLWCRVHNLFDNTKILFSNDTILQEQIECLSNALVDLYRKTAGPTQLNFSSSGSGITWVGHSGTPKWAEGNNYKNPDTWTSVPDTNHSNYWIDSNPDSLKGKFFMQYGGSGNGWASARFIDYILTISKQKTNTDGSIDITYVLEFGNFKGHGVDTGGITVDYNIKIQNQTIWKFRGDTGADYNISPNISKLTGNAHIEPNGTYSGALLNFHVSYPNGEYSANTFNIGFLIKNPVAALPECIKDLQGQKKLDC
ncbi:hypothetical protein [Enterococcus gallinarum]|uniref:hypothetical protein n=1 Tax=Enterococcus gallinarum TaxID=1353 RepID=UPI002891ADB1|nr:hypothetical protein [Enterococcus gallinarum]MDT2685796.1 hypothetical protein [Enterococcus gallinarum]